MGRKCQNLAGLIEATAELDLEPIQGAQPNRDRLDMGVLTRRCGIRRLFDIKLLDIERRGNVVRFDDHFVGLRNGQPPIQLPGDKSKIVLSGRCENRNRQLVDEAILVNSISGHAHNYSVV
ncbi:hypothetical protein [Arhodomonas sp. AD133]|uniref:hypothetical protein n=1 Tax=Arhodomonas sp. AD133 TaxID=3415009 RepID=UPI003EBD9DE8